MTRFSDNIYTGLVAITTAQSSIGSGVFCKVIRFTGGGNQTATITIPSQVQNLDAKLHILSNGSATTSDKINVSAAGNAIISLSQFGSANGILSAGGLAGLGVVTVKASAVANLNTQDEVTLTCVLSSVDTATDYKLQLIFNRVNNGVG